MCTCLCVNTKSSVKVFWIWSDDSPRAHHHRLMARLCLAWNHSRLGVGDIWSRPKEHGGACEHCGELGCCGVECGKVQVAMDGRGTVCCF